jgi:hypothetical protein
MAEIIEGKEEAQTKLDSEVNDMLEKLCPVFQEKCHGKNCMSFYPGQLRVFGQKFSCISPSCTSPLTTGCIEHDYHS